MSNDTDRLAALADVAERVGESLAEEHGGFLRCETCGKVSGLNPGMAARYMTRGWPKHCGYTMRWWTARQIAAGEVPA
jgi:hypothetical protein